MDEHVDDLATRRLGVLVAVALVAFAAHQAFGGDALAAVLVLAVGATALMAFHRLSGREWAGAGGWRRPEEPEAAEPVRDDAWRSERWVRESVERGLRSLDAWRFDQQAS